MGYGLAADGASWQRRFRTVGYQINHECMISSCMRLRIWTIGSHAECRAQDLYIWSA